MDRYAGMRDALFRTVLDGPASLDRHTRNAIATETNVPAALQTLVAKIHRHAHRVTDEDIRELLANGYTEDQLFEVIVSASVGAARARFEAAVRAIGADAKDSTNRAEATDATSTR
jgi:alkylhydroperoxidase family enzyme